MARRGEFAPVCAVRCAACGFRFERAAAARSGQANPGARELRLAAAELRSSSEGAARPSGDSGARCSSTTGESAAAAAATIQRDGFPGESSAVTARGHLGAPGESGAGCTFTAGSRVVAARQPSSASAIRTFHAVGLNRSQAQFNAAAEAGAARRVGDSSPSRGGAREPTASLARAGLDTANEPCAAPAAPAVTAALASGVG
jgi:hypothetical protein